MKDYTLQKKKKTVNIKTYNVIYPHEAEGNKRQKKIKRDLVICEPASIKWSNAYLEPTKQRQNQIFKK